MIHFIGAGSGAADLITVRGKAFLEEADVLIYAGSLVNPQLLDYAKEDFLPFLQSQKKVLQNAMYILALPAHFPLQFFLQLPKDIQSLHKAHTLNRLQE